MRVYRLIVDKTQGCSCCDDHVGSTNARQTAPLQKDVNTEAEGGIENHSQAQVVGENVTPIGQRRPYLGEKTLDQ